VHISQIKYGLITVLLVSCATENRDAIEAEYEAAERASIEELNAAERQRKVELFGDDRHNPNVSTNESSVENVLPATALVEPNDVDWLIGYYPDPKTGAEICSIVSPTQTISNGTLETQVNVVLTSTLIYFRADAALDISNPESGFRVDANFPMRFDQNVNEIAAVFDRSYARALSALEAGTVLEVTYANNPHLGELPLHTISYDIDPVAALIPTLNQCEES